MQALFVKLQLEFVEKPFNEVILSKAKDLTIVEKLDSSPAFDGFRMTAKQGFSIVSIWQISG